LPSNVQPRGMKSSLWLVSCLLAVGCSGSKYNALDAKHKAIDSNARRCISDLTHRNIEHDIDSDVVRRERHLFFVEAYAHSESPPGISGCDIIDGGPPRRSGPFSRYSGKDFDRTDLGSACAMAITNYQAAYNQRFLRRFQKLVHDDCSGHSPSIDKKYPFDDLPAFLGRLGDGRAKSTRKD
jgi:hypothetical protein